MAPRRVWWGKLLASLLRAIIIVYDDCSELASKQELGLAPTGFYAMVPLHSTKVWNILMGI